MPCWQKGPFMSMRPTMAKSRRVEMPVVWEMGVRSVKGEVCLVGTPEGDWYIT